MVLKRAKDWRGVLVLSFLFASAFFQYGIMGDPVKGAGSDSGPLCAEHSEHETPNAEAENQHYNSTCVPLQPYAGREAETRSLDPEKSNNVRHTCAESNEHYDCILKNVFINGSYHNKLFGSNNPQWNNQTKLKFMQSDIRTLPKTLVDTFSHVELLNMNLLQMETIEPRALKNGRNIKSLYLSYNNIASLDERLFDNLILLEIFEMDGNNLSSIPDGLFKNSRKLIMLSLAKNNLQRIGDYSFVHNIQLEYVNVSNNQLFHFDFSSIKNLFEVDVSKNKLKKLHISQLVENVHASHNEIHEVVVPKTNNLSLLILSHNNLSTTAWLQPFTKLVSLDLSYNKIEDITSNDFKQLQRLVSLKLYHNRLFTFDMSRNQMKSLKVLDLSNNELVYVEHNQKQFDLLEELYLDHNSIVALKPSSGWKIKNITLSNNDWDCGKMEVMLQSFPTDIIVDYNSETYCKFDKLPQGLCCKRVDMVYHDRLITKIAEVANAEKVARANGRCSAALLISSVHNTSEQVTKSQHPPSSQLEREIEALKAEFQRVQLGVQQKEAQITNNINEIDELTRTYRVVKKGLTLPSYTLGTVFAFLKQRDEFKTNETIARFAESNDKKAESEKIQNENGEDETKLQNKNERRKTEAKKIQDLIKSIKKLEREVNNNPKAIRNGK